MHVLNGKIPTKTRENPAVIGMHSCTQRSMRGWVQPNNQQNKTFLVSCYWASNQFHIVKFTVHVIFSWASVAFSLHPKVSESCVNKIPNSKATGHNNQELYIQFKDKLTMDQVWILNGTLNHRMRKTMELKVSILSTVCIKI